MVDPPRPSLCSNEHPRTPPRVALAHDWVVARRGGEHVLIAVADALTAPPDPAELAELAALLTMFHAGLPLSPALDRVPRRTSPLNRLPRPMRRWLLPLYPAAVAALSRDLARLHARTPIELLFSTSSVAIKALRPPPAVPHVCYCHTPARYLWSQTDAYASPDLKGRLRGLALRAARTPLRRWDRATASRVTRFLANSTHTRELIRLAYDRDAEVVHPPVRTDFFTPDATVPRDDSLLVVSALEPYKRVDLAIDASALLDRPLTVVGSGSHEHALRAHARANPRARVTFLGQATDETVRDRMRRAHAFLMPQAEDFGITAVEAQACATPVIARAAAGALDTVLPGRTGAFFEEPTPGSLAKAVENLSPDLGENCRQNALNFTSERFICAIRAICGQELRAQNSSDTL